MKTYTLTIEDMTADEAFDVFNRLQDDSVEQPEEFHAMAGGTADEQEADEPIVSAAGLDGSVINNFEPDADGILWDERIHASTKGKTAKGVWKRRRGVDDVVFDAVITEQRGEPVGATVENIVQAQPINTVVPMVANPVSVAAGAVPTPTAPTPTAPTPAAPTPTAPVRDFQGLMEEIGLLFANPDFDTTYPNTIVERINTGFETNLVAITDIAQNPQMVDYAWQCLDIDQKAA